MYDSGVCKLRQHIWENYIFRKKVSKKNKMIVFQFATSYHFKSSNLERVLTVLCSCVDELEKTCQIICWQFYRY